MKEIIRCSPVPEIEDILDLDDDIVILDPFYDCFGVLEGIKGTWHRLWAFLTMLHVFGGTDDGWQAAQELRAEFEEMLGRPMTAEEWQRLVDRARHHCDQVMIPLVKSFSAPKEGPSA